MSNLWKQKLQAKRLSEALRTLIVYFCFSCAESSCYSTVWRRCIFWMQCLLECNAKTVFFLEVANIQGESCLWGASWTMMHKAGDTFGHECANVDFHECENASTSIRIMYTLTFFLLLLFCKCDWTVKSKYYTSSCIGKDLTHYGKFFSD